MVAELRSLALFPAQMLSEDMGSPCRQGFAPLNARVEHVTAFRARCAEVAHAVHLSLLHILLLIMHLHVNQHIDGSPALQDHSWKLE